eukprot:s4375_g7.t1
MLVQLGLDNHRLEYIAVDVSTPSRGTNEGTDSCLAGFDAGLLTACEVCRTAGAASHASLASGSIEPPMPSWRLLSGAPLVLLALLAAFLGFLLGRARGSNSSSRPKSGGYKRPSEAEAAEAEADGLQAPPMGTFKFSRNIQESPQPDRAQAVRWNPILSQEPRHCQVCTVMAAVARVVKPRALGSVVLFGALFSAPPPGPGPTGPMGPAGWTQRAFVSELSPLRLREIQPRRLSSPRHATGSGSGGTSSARAQERQESARRLLEDIVGVVSSAGIEAGAVRGLQALRATLLTAVEAAQSEELREALQALQGLSRGEPVEDAPLARLLRRLFQRLGSTYVKLGQFIASSPTLFPAAYVREFQRCLDRTEPTSFAEIRRSLEADLGRPLSAVFRSFEEDPGPPSNTGFV